MQPADDQDRPVKILLVDDADRLDETASALQREGLIVTAVEDGAEILRRWTLHRPDVAVLSADQPSPGGLDLCLAIRQRGTTPVVLIGTSADDARVADAYRAGADDFVSRPIAPQLLALRIRALERRARQAAGPWAAQEQDQELLMGALLLDTEALEARYQDRVVTLTPIQFRLLRTLAVNAGHVVTRARLVESAWGFESSDPALLKNHIRQLRRKLKLPASGPGSIEAVPGLGYRLIRP
jgi:DNA-binding response OmpR family regulator